MKLYGAVLSPFVRMCLVTAHEVGLQDKLIHVPASVSPIIANPDFHVDNDDDEWMREKASATAGFGQDFRRFSKDDGND